jgi:anti-sigma-K factor RskA
MSDIHALSGAYAVDALDDDEREQFEQHLADCPECRAEVRSFCETAALIAETQTEIPPPSLRDSVLSGIGSIRPLPPETAPETPSTTAPEAEEAVGAAVTPLRRRTFPMLVAASVAVILLAVGTAFWHPWTGSQTTTVADQILHASDAVKVTEPVAGGGTLTIVRSPSLERAVMIGSDVAPPESGKTYQLWLQQPGQGMVSAGLMPDAEQPTVLTGDAATATAAAVSVEPATGSPRPTSDPIALFPFVAGGNGTA